MTATIHILVPQDRPRRDTATPDTFFRDQDPDTLPLLRRRLSLLAREVDLAGDLVTARNLGDLPRRLRKIGRMAGHLGLASLAHTAKNAANATYDPAFSALWARVLRLTEAALDPADTSLAPAH